MKVKLVKENIHHVVVIDPSDGAPIGDIWKIKNRQGHINWVARDPEGYLLGKMSFIDDEFINHLYRDQIQS